MIATATETISFCISAFTCDFSRRRRFCSLVVNCGGKRRTFVLRLATCVACPIWTMGTDGSREGGRIFDKFAGLDLRLTGFSKTVIQRLREHIPVSCQRRPEGGISQPMNQTLSGGNLYRGLQIQNDKIEHQICISLNWLSERRRAA